MSSSPVRQLPSLVPLWLLPPALGMHLVQSCSLEGVTLQLHWQEVLRP